MPFGSTRCPECRTRGRRFAAPARTTFDGSPAPVLEQERVCLTCGAWLWVARGEVTLAAPMLDAVLAGIAATDAFHREFQRASRAA